MRRTDLFVPTSKEAESSAQVRSAELALRSGLVDHPGAGIFSYSPTGERVRKNISDIIREKMNEIGAQEVSLPGLQYADIWRKSGRWEEFEGEMFTFQNREGKDMCLATTHEEPMAGLVRERVRSPKNMPLVLYQIGEKYRDDHPRNGLLRAKQFTMKDAYSFTTDEAALDEIYQEMRAAYIEIFDELGVEYAIVDADPSSMGGTASEEFQAPAEVGSDEMAYCPAPDCHFGTLDFDVDACPECGTDLVETNSIELGHIFKLGTRYSDPMDLTYDTESGQEEVIMGSYGIGVSRLIPALIEQRNDENGIIWPESVAPFSLSVVPLNEDPEIIEMAEEIHDRVGSEEVLLFDGDTAIGEKFAESDLIGVPAKVILGNTFLEDGELEVEFRDGGREYYEPADFFETYA
ncbi:aminoacyl--tRNA ligase-related protein [Halodesulfurarchaeum sp. HSR-GB]|uniref:aminoacyl--tRNA ligase-related protein n=1 Tax=Halodesulfurarchaeum sp. HSR-GB TaxID=3074077 RepID=UPI00285D6CB7|nr:aminoacyl--tRNA ligase-related protein [Halodesulfurarchaeum sp. HSR-GB]MDR5656958.1 aminoacyl--tRNA ligase-related protein [Halodesulfurarchaeum sp. HSR-GB]